MITVVGKTPKKATKKSKSQTQGKALDLKTISFLQSLSKSIPVMAVDDGAEFSAAFPISLDANMLSLTALSLSKASHREILSHILHGNYPDSFVLARLGYDGYALAGLAAQIRAAGVHVDTAAVQQCSTVGDVLSVMGGKK